MARISGIEAKSEEYQRGPRKSALCNSGVGGRGEEAVVGQWLCLRPAS